MGKRHNIKICQLKHSCKTGNCNKGHYTLLHNGSITSPPATNPPAPVYQGLPNNPNDTITSSHFKLSKSFLQILPLITTNGTKIVHTNAILDAGSNATLMRVDIDHILNLRGENKTLEIENALFSSSRFSER